MNKTEKRLCSCKTCWNNCHTYFNKDKVPSAVFCAEFHCSVEYMKSGCKEYIYKDGKTITEKEVINDENIV